MLSEWCGYSGLQEVPKGGREMNDEKYKYYYEKVKNKNKFFNGSGEELTGKTEGLMFWISMLLLIFLIAFGMFYPLIHFVMFGD